MLAPAWRWVFYLNVPIGIVALLIGCAASSGWESPRSHVGIDVVGAIVWSVGLAAGLGAVTLIGFGDVGGPDPVLVGAALAALSVLAILATIVRGLRRPDPFLDPQLFRRGSFSSAALVSLLTGFAFATAIIGGVCSSTASSTVGRTTSDWRSARWRRHGRRGPRERASAVRVLSLRLARWSASSSARAMLVPDVALADDDRDRGDRLALGCSGSGSA